MGIKSRLIFPRSKIFAQFLAALCLHFFNFKTFRLFYPCSFFSCCEIQKSPKVVRIVESAPRPVKEPGHLRSPDDESAPYFLFAPRTKVFPLVVVFDRDIPSEIPRDQIQKYIFYVNMNELVWREKDHLPGGKISGFEEKKSKADGEDDVDERQETIHSISEEEETNKKSPNKVCLSQISDLSLPLILFYIEETRHQTISEAPISASDSSWNKMWFFPSGDN